MQVAQWDFQNNGRSNWVDWYESHCALCNSACLIFYHVTGSSKEPTACCIKCQTLYLLCQLISTKTFLCYVNVTSEWLILINIQLYPKNEYLTWTSLHIALHCGRWLSSIRTENLRSYHQLSFVI